MSVCHLCGRARTALVGSAVTQMNHEEGDRSESSNSSRGPRKIPAREPRPPRRLGPWSRRFIHWRERQRDDRAAIAAHSEVSECLLPLMRRQSLFDKRAELVRVWMLPGLYEFAHSRSLLVA
jgi:hypothetical protein